MPLEIEAVEIGYGKKLVVHEATLRVGEREAVAIVGPNGAGKSTLLNGIFGIAQLSRGEIRWNGRSIVGLPPFEIVQAGISYGPQGPQVYRTMTVAENLMLGGYAAKDRGVSDANIRKGYELFPILYERRHVLASSLSGGERQMLALAAVLASDPKVVLLDEPSGGLAPLVARSVFDTVRRLVDEFGISVLLVEQNLKEAFRIADRAYVMAQGRITAECDRNALTDGQGFQDAFFGIESETVSSHRPERLAASEVAETMRETPR
jgi:branched-chain amino acid transport system ATP-binding protein